MSSARELIVCFYCCVIVTSYFVSSAAYDFPSDDEIEQSPVSANSKFKWIGHRTDFVMPWTRGPNVCAVEEVIGTRKRYYSECMAFVPRRVCQKNTFIRYLCCTGYEKEKLANSTGCQAVKPIDDLLETVQQLFLREFRKQLRTSDQEELLADRSATYTVFAPHNKAFNSLSNEIRESLGVKSPPENNLLRLHVVRDRFNFTDLKNSILIPTLYKNNQTLRVHRYSSGIVTVNCVRIILPDQPATNGLVHVTEQVIKPMAEHGDVYQVLLNDGRFHEFSAGLELALISAELSRNGTCFTVFAPTDYAFRNIDREMADRVWNDFDLLKRLLYYHIVDCCLCSAAILGPTSVRTLEGQKVNLSCDFTDRLVVNDIVCSEVDIVASNGVIHVIDEVLIPDSVKTISHQMDKLGIKTFVRYAKQAGFEDVLEARQGAGEATIFVPSEQAFQKLTASDKRKLDSNRSELKRIIEYHTVPGKMTTKRIVGNEVFRTGRTADQVNASGLFLHINVEEMYTVNNARVVSADHVVSNGVFHVIDRVLFPPEKYVVNTIQGISQLSTFLNLLELSGLDVMLNRSHHLSWTIFAPTDAAFDRMDDRRLARLMDNHQELLMFLNYHIVERAIFSCGIRPRLQYRHRTLTKDWIYLKQNRENDAILINNQSKITQMNIESVNGVVHVIDHVLMCPCLDWSTSGNNI